MIALFLLISLYFGVIFAIVLAIGVMLSKMLQPFIDSLLESTDEFIYEEEEEPMENVNLHDKEKLYEQEELQEHVELPDLPMYHTPLMEEVSLDDTIVSMEEMEDEMEEDEEEEEEHHHCSDVPGSSGLQNHDEEDDDEEEFDIDEYYRQMIGDFNEDEDEEPEDDNEDDEEGDESGSSDYDIEGHLEREELLREATADLERELRELESPPGRHLECMKHPAPIECTCHKTKITTPVWYKPHYITMLPILPSYQNMTKEVMIQLWLEWRSQKRNLEGLIMFNTNFRDMWKVSPPEVERCPRRETEKELTVLYEKYDEIEDHLTEVKEALLDNYY